jgi:hypothetical protein
MTVGKRHTAALFYAVAGALFVIVLTGCHSLGKGPSLEATRAAAERGDPTAQHRLADMYYYGRGVPRDYVEAEKWYRRATEQYKAVMQQNPTAEPQGDRNR